MHYFSSIKIQVVSQTYRPGQLFLKLLSVLVALVEVTGLSLHKVSEALHMVGLENNKACKTQATKINIKGSLQTVVTVQVINIDHLIKM